MRDFRTLRVWQKAHHELLEVYRATGLFPRFFQIAMGSASELEHHLLLAGDPDLLDAAAYAPSSAGVVVTKMLAALLRRVRERPDC
jgi:hypothetical protein